MVTPKEIRQKAENLYLGFVRAHLRGEIFFPRVIPCRKSPDSDAGIVGAMDAVRALKDESKEVTGCGYTIEWREVNSRRYGRNLFPDVIRIDSATDFLRFIDKEREFQALERAAMRIASEYPELTEWVQRNPTVLLDVAPEVEGLLEVVSFFRSHPQPDVFVRELPLSVDTKFTERQKDLLRRWFDIVLPPSAIRADEEHFERRYGLRYAEPHILIRFLDTVPRSQCGFPCDVLSLPLHTLGALPLANARVIIVENKVNLLTLPRLPLTIALGGMGSAVSLLRYCPWLSSVPITYWGDIDCEGFGILSHLRALFPNIRSTMMDARTLKAHAPLVGEGSGAHISPPPFLTDDERDAFRACAEGNLRLEQERIPQLVVTVALGSPPT